MTVDVGDVHYDQPILIGDSMPLQKVTVDGKPCWRYGDSGKPYPYDPNDPESEKGAKKKAIDQGLAMGDGELKKAAVDLLLNEIEKGDSHSREYLDAFHSAIMAHEGIDPALKDEAHKKARGGAGGKLRGRGAPPDGGLDGEDPDGTSPCTKALHVDICKVADNVVYGIVLRAGIADLQGDVMSKEDIAKACHDYMEEYRSINVGHKDDIDACPVECWIAKEPGMLGKRKYGEGDWLMGTRINDPETLAKVNTGLLKSYSIEGEGVRVPM